MTTFSALRTRAAKRYGDPGNSIVADGASATLASWTDYVNEAYRDILTAHPLWPWNEAQPATLTFTGGSTAGVALPADTWQILAVWDSTNQIPLVPLEGRSQYLQEYPQQTEVGQAMHYRVFGSKMYLYPAPTVTTNVRVDCLTRPVDLSADGDTPVFPPAYHHVLVEGALARAYQDDGNLQQAKVCSDRFEEIKALMKTDLLMYRQERYPEPIDTFL